MSDNLARGLDWTIRQRELEQAGELTHERRRRKARATAGRRAAVRVSLPAILGVVAALAVALLVLMNCIELTRLSTETVQLKSELQSLENQNAKLNAEYERMFDRATVQQAAEDAGMSMPAASQVSYVDLSDGDTVVVYQEEESGVLSQWAASALHGFEAIKEFFS
jgi:cell division protein FtsL